MSLASSAGYLVALWTAYRAGPEGFWGTFYDTAVLWILVPFVFLAVYFWAREQAGRWMLERGDVEGAWAWSSARVTPDFWMRGRREAQINRVFAARAALARGDQLAAKMILWRSPEDELPQKGEWVAHSCLRAELLFREGKPGEAREALEQGEARRYSESNVDRGLWMACMAELALERGDVGEAERLFGEALWKDEACARAWWVEARVALAKGWGHERGLEALDSARDALNAALPERAAEVAWVRAGLLEALDRHAEAGEERDAARALVEAGGADTRAEQIIRGQVSEEEE